jgi:DNA-binding GntR family transcriptional regulator
MTFEETRDAFPALRALQRRSSTAEYAAQRLRRQIADGKLPPGTRLREEGLSATFGVSRNTVREAFRLLAHERLLEHTLHRGVVVRALTAYDVRQIYTTRRLVQPLGIDAALHDPSRRKALDERVDDAMSAADASDWDAVGTADVNFHRTLVAAAAAPTSS